MKKMTILAVGAHPDDIELICAGTLARCADRGDKVAIAYVTNGNMGHYRIPPPKLARIREKEAREAAAVIGAEVIWVGLPDEVVFDDQETRLKIVDAIRTCKPDLIITHYRDDYHPDHRMTSKLVFDASFVCTIPHIKTKHSFHERVVPIAYMDTLAGLGFLPDTYVDITDTFEKKKEMLSKHVSQITWLKEHDKIDLIGFMKTVAVFRGLQCNTRYAEGFRMLETWPRMLSKRLLP